MYKILFRFGYTQETEAVWLGIVSGVMSTLESCMNTEERLEERCGDEGFAQSRTRATDLGSWNSPLVRDKRM